MRILYGVQATGNGHISRAKEFIPYLRQHGEVDVLLSGSSAEVDIGHPVTYRLPGLGFTFGKRGGIDYVETAMKLRPIRFMSDVRALDVDVYDLVVSDFEPVTAWACKMAGKPCVGLSHQAAFLSEKTPRPSAGNPAAELLFKTYAPCTDPVGLHYESYADFIWTPIIRSEVRRLTPTNDGHVTVYLPAYGDELLIPHLHGVSDISFHVFSKHSRSGYRNGNVQVLPVRNEDYLNSLEACDGLISGGGFEAPAEAMFLGKRLMVIPMRDQFEQKCNAEALKPYGIPVLDSVDIDFSERIRTWRESAKPVQLHFPDHAADIIEHVVALGRGTRAAGW